MGISAATIAQEVGGMGKGNAIIVGFSVFIFGKIYIY